MKALAAGLAALTLLATACAAGDDPTVVAPSATASAAASSATASAAAAPPAPAASVPAPTWKPCEDGFECAVLPVPLVEGDAAAGTVDLALTRRPAPDRARRLGSLVVNPGGPGASAIGFLQAAWTSIPERVRARFDLVAFDPRGVGRTAPVRCGTTAQLDAYFRIDPSPDDAAELTALQRGNTAFVAGCEQRAGDLLEHVSTADAAADLDRVRAAVGDQRLTYLGYSYGTSIGAAYLDAYPRRVRAMVLDGALDPALTWEGLLRGQSSGFDDALDAFLTDCQRTGCAFRQAVEGDLGEAYDALAARVDRTPLPAGGRSLGPGEFSLGVGAGLYDRAQGWPLIASALSDAQGGDGRVLLALSDGYLRRDDQGYANISEANTAVNCLDRSWPRDRAAYVALAERVRKDSPRFGPAIALSGLSCADWPVPARGTPHRVRGTGAPPVVVIGTTGDPATPYAWSVRLARQLDRGVLLTHVGEGHTVYRADAPECLLDPVDAYLVKGRVPSATRC